MSTHSPIEISAVIDFDRNIRTNADNLWSSLPLHLQLQGPLKLYDRDPRERDFMVSAKLNHLHLMFLLRFALWMGHEPDYELLTHANDILNLTVEAVLLRDRLANSGTSLVWRVAYYALPAAGIICMCLLSGSLSMTTSANLSMADVFQNLNVLVAEVDSGAFARPEHPNYVLLSDAVCTIKHVLSKVLSRDSSRQSPVKSNIDAGNNNIDPLQAFSVDEWVPWDNQDSWDFETDFWRNLAEHPILAGVDTRVDGLL